MDDRLRAYQDRIGHRETPQPDAQGLADIQLAHRRAIAFENLDVLLGRPIRIDSGGVFDKLVTRKRGGYCFEMNRLFADMLALTGLPSRPLLARPRLAMPPGAQPPRTHVLLLTRIEGKDWIADAGFGGSYVPPMPLEDRVEAQTPDGARHRLRQTGQGAVAGDWVMERSGPHEATDGRAVPGAAWQAQYTFDLADVAPDDLAQANHWTSTWEGSRFTAQPIVSLVTDGGFKSLTGRTLSLPGSPRYEISDGELGMVLASHFELPLGPEEQAALRKSGDGK